MIASLSGIKEPKVLKLGGKGVSLSVLINNGLNVPNGFVITSDAFFKFLKNNILIEKIEKLASEINKSNFQDKSKEIRKLILSGRIPEEIASEIKRYLAKLDVQHISIRSSGVSEDSLKASFAGLYDTFLNVKSESNVVLDCVKNIWGSLFNERAVIYRIRKKLHQLEGMAIVVQEMISAEVSGVTFTVHPSDERTLLIEASYGVGDMIVNGKIQPDKFAVERETLEIMEKKIGNKSKMSICKGDKIEVVDVRKELTQKLVILDEKIKAIAVTFLKVEKIFNYPQDIEWCISNNKLWLLQSRPITGVIK